MFATQLLKRIQSHLPSRDYSCEILSLAVIVGLSVLSRFWLILYGIAAGLMMWFSVVLLVAGMRYARSKYSALRAATPAPANATSDIVHI